MQELRLTEPMVLCSVVKWCWSRLQGGVVSWDAYELFRTGEHGTLKSWKERCLLWLLTRRADSNMARDSFATFIPLSVDSDARTKIIFDFFELLAAIAAHGKTNGLGGRKLSRLAGWWAFEHADSGKGFDGGYKGWAAAADATSHLFFAYLRTMTPESIKGINGVSTLPISLQKLVQETEYPPQTPTLMLYTTPKVVMIVNSVSPSPFALLRRANNFQYRDQDAALQEFSNYEDPVKALTDECRRVLRCISSSNDAQVTTKNSTSLGDPSWSRFEDLGFSSALDESDEFESRDKFSSQSIQPLGLRTAPASGNAAMGRPTTPSWADFLSSGFVAEEGTAGSPLLLPPDKQLPPIETVRGRSSQSHRPRLESDRDLEPGELASISSFDLDESFWWVWISSLAGEEPAARKAAFGRCAVVETIVPRGKWLVIEEQVKGAAPEPDANAYVAEKKSRMFWSKRGKTSKKASSTKELTTAHNGNSKTSIGQDQQARIQAAAAQLQQKKKQHEAEQYAQTRRGRENVDKNNTNSVMTLQPAVISELTPAMQWASKYDKEAIREAYLANSETGKGTAAQSNGKANGHPHVEPPKSPTDRDLPAVPKLSAKSEIELSKQVETIMTPSAVPKAPLPPQPEIQTQKQTYTGNVLTDKQIEANINDQLPQAPHPAERPGTPLRTKGDSESSHLITPPRKTQQQSLAQFLNEEAPPQSPPVRGSVESPERHHKLKKKITNEKTSSGGAFKNIFGRKKNRNSLQLSPEPKPAPPPAEQKPNLLAAPAPSRRFGSFRKRSSPVITPVQQEARHPASINEDAPIKPAEEQPSFERTYEPSFEHSRVNTADASEARNEFSRFDQGPMDDMPAFVPADDVHDVEPSPVPSRPSPATSTPVVEEAKPIDIKKAPSMLRPVKVDAAPAEPALTPAQDRWAQIRKQAAERAAQRMSEDSNNVGGRAYSRGSGEETDGEESKFHSSLDFAASILLEESTANIETAIESRVARIKARVAELTGNMEDGPGAPGRTASPARR